MNEAVSSLSRIILDGQNLKVCGLWCWRLPRDACVSPHCNPMTQRQTGVSAVQSSGKWAKMGDRERRPSPSASFATATKIQAIAGLLARPHPHRLVLTHSTWCSYVRGAYVHDSASSLP